MLFDLVCDSNLSPAAILNHVDERSRPPRNEIFIVPEADGQHSYRASLGFNKLVGGPMDVEVVIEKMF
jgi:hypothetical protein